MNAPVKTFVPVMQELNVSNRLLGNQKALQEAWERDGYWFFRDVLDQEAVGALRQKMIDHLAERHLVDPADPQYRYTGVPLGDFRPCVEEMVGQKAYRFITENANVNAFFEKLFGMPACWVPFNQYRATPPTPLEERATGPYFDMIHEDGIYNEGLDFIICWIPLAEITAETGGLALADGLHKGPCLHERSESGLNVIPLRPDQIAPEAWRRTTYQAGDVLLMSLRTVHSGLQNHSDRFRLSLDTRIMPRNGKEPIVGTLTDIGPDHLTVRDEKNQEITLSLDAQSYCRGQVGERIPGNEVHVYYRPGHEVIVKPGNGRVVNMRPQH